MNLNQYRGPWTMDHGLNEEPATLVRAEDVKLAAARLQDVVNHTPLLRSVNLSEKYEANIYLKREDLQVVRSYKLRGAYNKICSLTPAQLVNGIVCASAGNHAQGVAYSCHKLGIKGHIFMPVTTPPQKLKQVQLFGKEHVEIVLTGDTFDDSYLQALAYSNKNNTVFIHPFDDPQVIAGQGTVGLEILAALNEPVDLLLLPVGGGGLAAGVSSYFREESPNTILIGVEPEGAAAMKKSIETGKKRCPTSINLWMARP